MPRDISRIWEELLAEADSGQDPASRVYRALGDTAVGIRAGVIPRDRVLEVLIEVPPAWEGAKSLPEWRGMSFEVLPLSLLPRQHAHHLRLHLRDQEHKPIFLAFCEDLLDALEGTSDAEARVTEIEASIARWERFFEKCGPGGLSATEQRGLFAELVWMLSMREAGVPAVAAVSSWKGCERGYHDFDLSGSIVEVKSTVAKEPRSVTISNERQLDDRGLRSLHLFVLTLHAMQGGGTTLPGVVQSLRESLAVSPGALSKFERRLVSAGYLEQHAPLYTTHYTVRGRELFRVAEGFPRIVLVPPGVGHLRYSVALAACQSHLVDLASYLTELGGN